MSDQPTSLRLSKQLKDFLWRCAADEHRSFHSMVVHILELYRASITRREASQPANRRVKKDEPQ